MDNHHPALIRRCVASGEFAQAQALWEIHAQELYRELETGAFSNARFEETRDLAEWCRTVALCARARAQAQLDRLGAAARYDGKPERGAPGILALF